MNKLLLLGLIFLFSFSLASASLVITSPSNNLVSGMQTSPLITWSGCVENSYLLQIATDESFNDMFFQKVIFESLYQSDFTFDSKTYYLRVNSINDLGEFSCTSQINKITIKDMIPLTLSFNEQDYETHNRLKIVVGGPVDADVMVEISSEDGFFLPIHLSDLSNPLFDVILEPNTYTFKASSSYFDDDLLILQKRIVPISSTVLPVSTDDENKLYFEIEVTDFYGSNLDDVQILLFDNIINFSINQGVDGIYSSYLDDGEYTIFISKKGYSSTEKLINLTEDTKKSFVIISADLLDDLSQNDGVVGASSVDCVSGVVGVDCVDASKEKFSKLVTSKVILKNFDETVFATSYVPLIFELDGSAERCQILKKESTGSGYSILRNILDLNVVNEVILTNLPEGEIELRVRCIISPDEAITSPTISFSTIDIAKDLKKLDELSQLSSNVINKINSFPTSFKQVFIDDMIFLEGFLSSAKELSKRAQNSDDVLKTRNDINSLIGNNSRPFLETVKVDSSENIITYVDDKDVDLVINYLDLAKSNEQLLEDQSQFVIKTSYNFVTLTYGSGEIKKETFVSVQIIPIAGVSQDISYEYYFSLPTFLVSRLAQNNDVIFKSYDDKSLVRILENSSALVFEGWLADISLIRTIVLADDAVASNSITGFASSSRLSSSQWYFPLLSFLLVIIIVGLFFNPYYSVFDALNKNNMNSFTTHVHNCIDATLSKEYGKVIEIVPKALDIHKKFSKVEKEQVTDIMNQVEGLFYDSTFNLSLQKIISKPANSWSFEELEMAIKDFYGSYSKLSKKKQQEYLPSFTQMIAHSEQLLSQVKK